MTKPDDDDLEDPLFPAIRCKAARFNNKGKLSGEYDDILIACSYITLVKESREAGHCEVHTFSDRVFVIKGSIDEFYG